MRWASYIKKDKKFRIFVVDDEEVISSTIAAILRLKGFEAAAPALPLEALQASRSQVPDLLISDLVMPVLSGLDLATQVQAFHSRCRVLLFSGEWAAGDFSDSASQSKFEFEMIPKPVHPRELLKKVGEILAAVPVKAADGEDRARIRVAENMKQTIAAVQAEIAVSKARKRALK